MVKQETLRGSALDACPKCGETKKWYAQHWRRSKDCRYPRIEADQHALLQGLLLGDGSLDGNSEGNAKFRFTTTSKQFAGWVYEELGWLATKLERHSQPGTSDGYRVKAAAHPDCNRYRTWYTDGKKRLPPYFCFVPRSARAFHACDGNLSFGGRNRPHVEFRAGNSRYKERLISALSRWDVPTTTASGIVRIPKNEVEGWVKDIGQPVPGVEHKWELQKGEYDTLISQ